MTETERLLEWMKGNEMNAADLAREIGVSYDGVYQALYVRCKLSDGFKFRFVSRFGLEIAGIVFDLPTPKEAPTPA